MSYKYRISLALAACLFGIVLSRTTMAQTVDPCQYGCPKSGCPNCPEGGPIKHKSKANKATKVSKSSKVGKTVSVVFDSDKCVSSCDMQYSACEKRTNDNAYCNGQHNTCVANCYKHK